MNYSKIFDLRYVLVIYIMSLPYPQGYSQTASITVTASPSTVNCPRDLSILEVKAITVYANNVSVYKRHVETYRYQQGSSTDRIPANCYPEVDILYYAKVGNYYYRITSYSPSVTNYNVSTQGSTYSQLTADGYSYCGGEDIRSLRWMEGPLSTTVNVTFSNSTADFNFSWSHGLGSGIKKNAYPTATTTYTVTATPKSGTIGSRNKSVTVSVANTLEPPVIESEFPHLCAGQEGEVIIRARTAASNYYWYKDGVHLPGYDGFGTLYVKELGSYSLKILGTGGCLSAFSNIINVDTWNIYADLTGNEKGCEFVDLSVDLSGVPSGYDLYFYWLYNGNFEGNTNKYTYRATKSGEYSVFVQVSDSKHSNCTYYRSGETLFAPTPPCPNCIFYSNTVNIDIVDPISADAGDDQQVCSFETKLGAIGGVGQWTMVSGTGIATFDDAYSPNSVVSVTQKGIYQFEWNLLEPVICADHALAKDIVEINFIAPYFDVYVDNYFPTSGDPVVLNLYSGANGGAQSFIIDWGDGNKETVYSSGIYYHYYQGYGDYIISVLQNNTNGLCTKQTDLVIYSMCSSEMKVAGDFKMDKHTGVLFFEQEECASEIPFTCLIGPGKDIDRLVTSNVVVMEDYWPNDKIYEHKVNGPYSINAYETGKSGQWRVKKQFAYNTTLEDESKAYAAGRYSMRPFSWKNEFANPPSWVKGSSVEYYSPNGEPLQERNALNISSVAKFGYYDALPYLTAQNAIYESVYFESFENFYGNGRLEDGVDLAALELTSSYKHAGKYSLKLAGGEHLSFEKVGVANENTQMIAKVWVKAGSEAMGLVLKAISREHSTQIAEVSFLQQSQLGEWRLFSTSFNCGNTTKLQLEILNSGNTPIWIDDLRIQPAEAQMSTYVYDKDNLRLLTIFDDQNYGLFYQYNDEGKLVRKLLETERGVQTLQETFYNLPKESR